MRHLLIALAAPLVVTLAAPVAAQPYPSKPVRIIASYPAGGGVDVMARLVAQKLSQQFSQQFIVENRAGAGGTIGADAVAKAAPDGYTILAGGNPELTFMPHVIERLPYDPQRDLAPLVLAANAPSVVVVHPAFKVSSMKELLALARDVEVPYGTPGRGTPMHLSFELLNAEAGTKFIHVPYKGGGPATNDVVGGQINVAVINAPPVLPQIKAGKLRALAVMQNERSGLLPNVPTFSEATGIENIAAPAWFAFLAPAATPVEIRNRLEQAIRQALNEPDLRAKLAAMGLDVVALPATRFAGIIRAESAYNAQTIRRLGYKPE